MSNSQQSASWENISYLCMEIQKKSREGKIIEEKQIALRKQGAENVSLAPYKELTKQLKKLDEEIEDLEKKQQALL